MPKHGRLWRYLFVLHLYAFLGVLGLTLLTAGAGWLAWRVPVARRFVHTEVVRYYLRDVAPKLPFTIEDLDVDAKWTEFLKGWIRRFTLDLRWNDWELKLSGPIQISFDHGEGEKHLNATYLPLLEAQAVEGSKTPFKKLPPLPLTLAFRAEANFSHLDSLTLHTTLKEWKWEEMHLKLEDFSLGAGWTDKIAQISLSGKSIGFDDPGRGRQFNLTNVDLSTLAPLTLSPFRAGPEAEFDLSAKRGSTHWEGTDLNLPLSHFPVHGRFGISSDPNGEDSIELRAGSASSSALEAHAKISRSLGHPKSLALQWKTRSIALRDLLSGVRGAIPDLFGEESPINDVKKISGTLQTHGSASIPLPWTADSLRSAKIDGLLDANQVSFEWPMKDLAVAGLDLHLPVSSREGIQGSFTVQRILYRRFQGSLGKTEIDLTPEDSNLNRFKIHLGGPSAPDGSKSFPLKIGGLPLQIGNIDGDVSKTDWDVGTSLNLEPTEISSIMHQLCMNTDHIPPAQVVASFPKIDWSPATLDPEGTLRVNLFKGSLELSDIGVYDANSSVPEVDFDLNLDGVRLDQLGDWAGFGEMDGILKAHAHDVVFQAWLPTQYDFQFEAKPLKHTKVVFSPEAMKNLARLVASESIDHLPGIAEWAAFGLPSHLLGGYDIWFMGISLFSHDGHILMEVLDPPDLPVSVIRDHKQNHYILYANRFTIPLKTSHYPLILDATTVSNYIYGQAVPRLLRLRQAKKALEKKNEIERKQNENAPMDCAPPTL